MPDLVGRTLGPYRIVEQIGLGGMATVYKAYQPSMDRYVALKVLSTHLTQDATFVKRFQQEAKVIAKLEHLHILPVHDHGQEDGYLYLVMRFIEAGTLKDRLRGGPLSLSEVRHIVSQVGSALEYAHQLGVVHRDIKPSNVLIDRQGDCYLTDFGIAKMAEGTLGLTGSGLIGTPHYMAPEQGQSLKVDHRADIYAMGVVIYEMVTGRVPYDAETPIAVVMKHITEPLPLPRSLRPDLPEAVERVILKALAKAPADRTQSMRDLVAAFDEAVSAAPSWSAGQEVRPATAPAAAVSRPSPPTPIISEGVTKGETAVVSPTTPVPARRRSAAGQLLWWLAAAGVALIVLVLACVILERIPIRAVLPTPTATPAVAAVIPATLEPPTATYTPQPSTPTPTALQPPPTAFLHDTWNRPTDGMVMVYVPGGTFEMGSTADAALAECQKYSKGCNRDSFTDEEPPHTVTLDGFWIDRTEVTNAQYARCVAAGVCRVLWHPNTVESYYGDSQYDEYPVVWMDWNSAATYCEWAGGRLPSEAEWEYAARGPDGHIYPWGNDPPDDTLLNYDKPTGHATKVGSYPKGQSWAGALDMAGNAWESVNDGYNSYPSEPQVNPTGPASGPLHVVRGGSWLLGIEYARAASRDVISEGGARSDMGVRCVVAPSITETPTVTALARPPSPTPTPQPPTAMPTPTPSTGSTKTRSADGMVMVYVPAGSFPMGSTDAQVEAVWQACKTRDSTCERSGMFEGELPQHRVTLDAFWIDRTEVTNAQYARCVAAGVCRPPSESGSRTRESYYENSQYDEYPVILVSWDEATTYCRWAGGRLPSEAEWEYAARGPEGRVYPWGNQFDGAKLNYCVANCQLDGYSDTAPVGSYPGGASWVGALDMAGNVWEWVNDWNGNYPSEPQVNPGGPASGTYRIMRGGGWFDDLEFVRAATRVVGLPVGTYDHVGVRCVVAPGS